MIVVYRCDECTFVSTSERDYVQHKRNHVLGDIINTFKGEKKMNDCPVTTSDGEFCKLSKGHQGLHSFEVLIPNIVRQSKEKLINFNGVTSTKVPRLELS